MSFVVQIFLYGMPPSVVEVPRDHIRAFLRSLERAAHAADLTVGDTGQARVLVDDVRIIVEQKL